MTFTARQRRVIGAVWIFAAPAPAFAALLMGLALATGRGGVAPAWTFPTAIGIAAAIGAVGAAILPMRPSHRMFIAALMLFGWSLLLFSGGVLYAFVTSQA